MVLDGLLWMILIQDYGGTTEKIYQRLALLLRCQNELKGMLS